MNNLPFIILGVLPSFIWLLYFLEKDRRPEPRITVTVVFLFGMAGTGIIALLQPEIRSYLVKLDFLLSEEMTELINSFLSVGLLEESVKLLAMLGGVYLLNVKELDEPVDFLIYMITAGLGFAALENILYFSGNISNGLAGLVLIRFAITTLFHGLVAGIMGYFLAYGVFKMKTIKWGGIGLLTAAFLHTLFNKLLAVTMRTHPGLLLLFIGYLAILTAVVMKAFRETKKRKGVCKLN